MIRELKREVNEYKRKYIEANNQLGELRKERDDLLSQKGDENTKVNKAIDQEKVIINNLENEIERLKFKLKCTEEDLQKELSQIDEKQRLIHSLKLDKSSQETLIKEKERTIMTLNRQLNDTKDDLKNKEREFRVTLQKLTDDSAQTSSNQNLKIDALKSKIQDLEKSLYEATIHHQKVTERLEEDKTHLQKESNLLAEELKTLKKSILQLTEDHTILQRSLSEGKFTH